ncbi:RNA recognition motif-containing protein [Thermochaetoides thermophila DSM 1495]|uniref:RNA recognition motif-containing protein n=1 Tax=Chaetomium thermophilum (strain DSM 1495 / CBS 144.50 / IMI 039719) TaxID=759272 RepID=G0S940_CHATD|nr:RNA recognition motif-containing protein [Thermochaetoides thermophila DSM 1495]EGS19951.1 RNA recognition motif-containing protein [Thermochaetoides thermophila DSM 1495]
MATTVHVKNIGLNTADKEIKDFFSFCGKITSIEITAGAETKSATVTFEKETAARTALLLNHTSLGGNEILVEGEASAEGPATPPNEPNAAANGESSPVIRQEEKPRARILAEILAHGYCVAEAGIQAAIALDEKHNVTQRFLNTLKNLDAKYHATDRALAADAQYNLTGRATSLLTGLSSYFEKASHTPTGKRIVDFYTAHSKQVQDIHAEARRLADLKKEEAGGDPLKASGLNKVPGLERVLNALTHNNNAQPAAQEAQPAAATA